jgi:uncharacterized protein YegP (UPF0339 family)
MEDLSKVFNDDVVKINLNKNINGYFNFKLDTSNGYTVLLMCMVELNADCSF